MSFDLSFFPKIGKWLFDTGVKIYKLLEFKFGDFTLNGWIILLGIAVCCIIFWLIGRILD